MPLIDNQARDRIRELNDAFRKSLDPNLGKVLMTSGVSALPSDLRAMAIREVETFDGFSSRQRPAWRT